MTEGARRATGWVSLVGAGPGDPGLITVRGLERLRQAEVVVYDRLVGDRLLAEIPAGAEKIYVGKETGSHTLPQHEINALLVAKALDGKRVVRLKGGDPFVFGRGGEEAQELVSAGVSFEVVPGVTSAIAVAAYAGIPVTQREVASSFAVVTGREDPTKPETVLNWEALAKGVDTLVCLMGMKNLPHIVEELVSHGRPPETPVALVRWGTWKSQETLTGTLQDIVQIAEARHFGPPAVTIIGEVVKLREELRWFDSRPLFGKRVLVTRAREQADDLSTLLSEAGAIPIEVPVIQIDPPESWEAVDGAIERLSEYGWVVFTSANGVRSFFGRLGALGKDCRALGACRVAAIGPATAQALLAEGIRPDLVPERHVGEALSAELARTEGSGRRVLIARAAVAREVIEKELRALGWVVDVAEVYRTVPVEASAARLADLLAGDAIDAVTFASSSAVKNVVDALGKDAPSRLEKLVVACIGPVTADTARELEIKSDVVASEYTMPGLVKALVEYYAISNS
ncbi:MAG TPA: uroporphyrinogen-III C-methyltransferase [Chloroflexota bacterium]